MVPATDREFVWNQVVDTIDDYFRIEQESRVKLIGGVLTEGRIDTYPTIGSTLFEPWARDSTPGYERLHATLQSIRRKAIVRVTPTDGAYLIHVAVQKEQEEVAKTQHAIVGGTALTNVVPRYDGSLERAGRHRSDDQSGAMLGPGTLAWIPLGRDFTLEQRILRELRGRLLDPDTPIARPPGNWH